MLSLFLKFASKDTLIKAVVAIVKLLLKSPSDVTKFENVLNEIHEDLSIALGK